MLSLVIHRVTASFLIMVLLANNINTLILIGDFIINQDVIATTLCVQKEEQKGCNGKCQLRNKLSDGAQESDSKSPFQENTRTLLDHFCLFFSENSIANCDWNTLLMTYNQPEHNKIINIYLEVETPPPVHS
ncbi:MAG: hypothetical protein GY891_06495 [Bacteroidetes bacterium]|nr:hypothetical protein [Bacteroidota bacterium]